MTIEETIRLVKSKQNGRIINQHCYGEVTASYKTVRRMVEDFAKACNTDQISVYWYNEDSRDFVYWHSEDCVDFKLIVISDERYPREEDYHFVTFEEDKCAEK
ncbi:MAG: hypothetical protein ACRDD8_16485 [Bacteroidales bacterium]